MNIKGLIFMLAPFAFPLAVAAAVILPRRIRMERRARALLAEHPGAERTSIYLPLHSIWAWEQQREIDAKVAEMQPQGWIFLRAVEASPLRMIRSWSGALTLQFIRDAKTSHVA